MSEFDAEQEGKSHWPQTSQSSVQCGVDKGPTWRDITGQHFIHTGTKIHGTSDSPPKSRKQALSNVILE